jgi:hypothetical protein
MSARIDFAVFPVNALRELHEFNADRGCTGGAHLH